MSRSGTVTHAVFRLFRPVQSRLDIHALWPGRRVWFCYVGPNRWGNISTNTTNNRCPPVNVVGKGKGKTPLFGLGKCARRKRGKLVCVWTVVGFPFWDSATVSRILFLVHRVVASRLEQSNRAIESILIGSSFSPSRTHTPKGNWILMRKRRRKKKSCEKGI